MSQLEGEAIVLAMTATPHREFSRMDWQFKNKLIGAVIANGGMVFGGTARDKYLHDCHAHAFYNEDASIRDMYNLPVIMPELSGRFVTPNDIDAYICKTNHAKLINSLRRVCPSIHEIFHRDLRTYFPDTNIPVGQITHYRYKISMMAISPSMMGSLTRELSGTLTPMNRYSFLKVLEAACEASHIDLMVATFPSRYQYTDPPFGMLDFECNGLILDQTGFRLSRQLIRPGNDPYCHTKKFMNVLKQIESKQAVLVNLRWYRVSKMESYGWEIQGLYKEIEPITADYSGHCIICHSHVPHEHFKLKCCDARYHVSCLYQASVQGNMSMMAKNKCIMCSTPLKDIKSDVLRFTSYMTYKNYTLPLPPPTEDIYADMPGLVNDDGEEVDEVDPEDEDAVDEEEEEEEEDEVEAEEGDA